MPNNISPLLFVTADDYTLLKLIASGVRVELRHLNHPNSVDDWELRTQSFFIESAVGWADLHETPIGELRSPVTLIHFGWLALHEKTGRVTLTDAGRALAALPEDSDPEATPLTRLLRALAAGMPLAKKSTWRGVHPPSEPARAKGTVCGYFGFWRTVRLTDKEWGRVSTLKLIEATFDRDTDPHLNYPRYHLTPRGARKAATGVAPAPALTTTEGHTCPGCERVFSPDSETESGYECDNCGTQFTRTNSADGSSHRCPDCNKFAHKSDTPFCPDCEEPLEEATLAQNAAGEWVTEETAEDEAEAAEERRDHA